MDNTNLSEKVKTMTKSQMVTFAEEIRQYIISSVAANGGHLASNLGVVELTLALHRAFDFSKDKIVWDVGHQSYVHKMLTGRWDDFSQLRQKDGISGFPKRNESPYDFFDSGHSGTSISAALGYATARDLNGESHHCIAVIGDGAITGGVAYEALNQAGSTKTPLIVILNDNTMSISSNVGAMSKYLGALRTSDAYLGFKKNLKKTFQNMPKVTDGLQHVRDKLKQTFVPETIFEDLGFKYYGPIDGHDIDEMTRILLAVKKMNRPVLIHVVTQKGKGFGPAEENPSKYHGIGPFDPETADAKVPEFSGSWSDYFGRFLCEEAVNDSRIVAITAAMMDSTGLLDMKHKFPQRVFDVGIAEQDAVSFAAGLALGGKHPVFAVYSTFLQRAYDQVLTEVCLQNLPVIFAVDRAGVTGQDGETHQGIFDISFLSSMPNMRIYSPSTASELQWMLSDALKQNCPCAIRYPRGKAPVGQAIENLNSIEPLRQGSDLLFLSSGTMDETALKAAEILEKKHISAAVSSMKVLCPLDHSSLMNYLADYNTVVTIEDGIITGGFGNQIAAICSENTNIRVLNLGWPKKFIEHGKVPQLCQNYGLDPEGIARTTEALFEKKA